MAVRNAKQYAIVVLVNADVIRRLYGSAPFFMVLSYKVRISGAPLPSRWHKSPSAALGRASGRAKRQRESVN